MMIVYNPCAKGAGKSAARQYDWPSPAPVLRPFTVLVQPLEKPRPFHFRGSLLRAGQQPCVTSLEGVAFLPLATPPSLIGWRTRKERCVQASVQPTWL